MIIDFVLEEGGGGEGGKKGERGEGRVGKGKEREKRKRKREEADECRRNESRQPNLTSSHHQSLPTATANNQKLESGKAW